MCATGLPLAASPPLWTCASVSQTIYVSACARLSQSSIRKAQLKISRRAHHHTPRHASRVARQTSRTTHPTSCGTRCTGDIYVCGIGGSEYVPGEALAAGAFPPGEVAPDPARVQAAVAALSEMSRLIACRPPVVEQVRALRGQGGGVHARERERCGRARARARFARRMRHAHASPDVCCEVCARVGECAWACAPTAGVCMRARARVAPMPTVRL